MVRSLRDADGSFGAVLMRNGESFDATRNEARSIGITVLSLCSWCRKQCLSNLSLVIPGGLPYITHVCTSQMLMAFTTRSRR
jgi:hypothetical protein